MVWESMCEVVRVEVMAEDTCEEVRVEMACVRCEDDVPNAHTHTHTLEARVM